MSPEDSFAKWLVMTSVVGVFLLVAGVLFGPWTVDPQAAILISLVAQPGGVALGWILQKKSGPEA